MEGSKFNRDYECYSLEHMFLLVPSVIGMVMISLQSLIYLTLYNDMCPTSHIPFAGPSIQPNGSRFIFKAVIITIFVIDYELKNGSYYQFLMSVYYSIHLYIKYRFITFFNRVTENFTTQCDTAIFWITFSTLIKTILSNGNVNVSLFYMVQFLPFFSYTFMKIVSNRRDRIHTENIQVYSSDEQVLSYLINMRLFIGLDKSEIDRLSLESLLSFHVKYCDYHNCYCYEINTRMSTIEEKNLSTENIAELKQRWLLFLESITLQIMCQYPKSVKLHLNLASQYKNDICAQYKAVYEQFKSQSLFPNIQEEFFSYRTLKQIESQQWSKDTRVCDRSGIHFSSHYEFQKKFIDFCSLIEEVTYVCIKFFNELNINKSIMTNINRIGDGMLNLVDNIDLKYTELLKTNEYHYETHYFYAHYLKNILACHSRGEKILEKAGVIRLLKKKQKFIKKDYLQYDLSSNCCIISASGNRSNRGQIRWTNNKIYSYFGYKNSDLVGDNITMLMPKIYADFHDRILKNYFESRESESKHNELSRFKNYFLHKNGYLVPTQTVVMINPSLSRGLEMIAFVSLIKLKYFFIY